MYTPNDASADGDLNRRIQALQETDKKLTNVLEYARDLIENLEKDRQLSKNKFEECYKKFSTTLEEINNGISDQLAYIEEMCVGAEHQGSTFAMQQHSQLASNSLGELQDEFRRVASETFGISTATKVQTGDEE
jgi:mediator of RNA polymerase II transcription subunit 11